MQDMKDPIQGTLDAVRGVEIRIEQIRLLWGAAETARASAESEVESLRVELERAKAHADVKSARHARNRLRRSNDRVREVLEAEPGESPVAAAERLRGNLAHTAAQCDLFSETSGREIERLRADLGSVRDELRASENKRITETQAIRAGWAVDRKELLQRNREAMDERDAALARAAEANNRPMDDAPRRIALRLAEYLRKEPQASQVMWTRTPESEWTGFQLADLLETGKSPLVEEYMEWIWRAATRIVRLRPVPVEGEVRSMDACCSSARFGARNEAASALFRILRPGSETPPQGAYVLNTALAEVTEEINALRKDRETLNRVRGAVEAKS